MKTFMYVILFLTIGIIVFSFYNEMTMSYPIVEFYQDHDVIRVKKSNEKSIRKNDILISCDSVKYANSYELDENIEKFPINSVHIYKFISSKTGKSYSVVLKHHRLTKYGNIITLLLISIFFLIMAYLIISISPNKLYTFFIFMFFITVAIAAVTYRVCFYNIFLYSLLIISVSFIPGFYIAFLSVFPRKFNKFSVFFYSMAILISAVISVIWLKTYFNFLNYKITTAYISLMDVVKISQIYSIMAILIGIVLITLEYFHSDNYNKKRLKWLIVGQIIGYGPFLILFSLPLLLFGHEWSNFAYVFPFFIMIPITFIFGISKYKLGYINFILARSIVVIIYLFLGIVLWLLFREFCKTINLIILRMLILTIFIALYSLLVYFTYSSVLKRILFLFFKEYYRKIVLINRYIDLLLSKEGKDKILPGILEQVKKVFDLEYIGIGNSEVVNGDRNAYDFELNNKKIVYFKKKGGGTITIDEIFILKNFLNSLVKNNIV